MKLKKDLVARGSMTGIRVKGRRVLVANVEGRYYAVSGSCPHLFCGLHKGKLEGKVVVCPCHDARFDVTDGSLLEWAANTSDDMMQIARMTGWARGLKVYKVEEEGDSINIEPY